jgi:hypothetical protein
MSSELMGFFATNEKAVKIVSLIKRSSFFLDSGQTSTSWLDPSQAIKLITINLQIFWPRARIDAYRRVDVHVQKPGSGDGHQAAWVYIYLYFFLKGRVGRIASIRGRLATIAFFQSPFY